MPTTTYKRTWCVHCEEFTLFLRPIMAPHEMRPCSICKTEYVHTPLYKIPEQKLNDQRKRYSDSRFEILANPFINVLVPKHDSLLDMVGSDIHIVEDDCGQRDIDAKNEETRKAIRAHEAEQRKLHLAEREKYIHLTRNDTCACGSGKKYKRCCINKFI